MGIFNYFMCYVFTLLLCVCAWCANQGNTQWWCVLGVEGVRRQPWEAISLFPCEFWGTELRWSDLVASTVT